MTGTRSIGFGLGGTTSSALSVLRFKDDRMGVDGYDTNSSAFDEHASLLMRVRDITSKSGESEVWAFRQDDRGFETLQPLVRLLCLQLDKES